MFRTSFSLVIAAFISFMIQEAASAQSQGAVKVLDAKARAQLSLVIHKKVTISVDSYRKDVDAFVIRIEREPDVGPNTTTLDWLLEAVDNGMSEKEMKKNPSKLIGAVFRLKKDLLLLSDEELAARAAKIAAKK